jgi:Ni/Fe-hydrogenase 1 B-type cytochrome subunit
MQIQRTRVYVWQVPVRLTHWLNVVALMFLIATGLYLGSPYLTSGYERSFLAGDMRFIHYVAGYLLLMMVLLRIYWMFAGNEYSNWRRFFPLTEQNRRDLIGGLKFYAFLERKPPYAVGHTVAAGFSYFFVFLMFIFEIISGFALYYINQPSTVHLVLGGWLLSLMHLHNVRLWHHLVMYFLIVFTLIHVYIAWYLDSKERNGVMGSIFGGFKFVTGKEWE